MPATPTLIASGSFADGGSGKLVLGAGPAVGEWDVVVVGSETTVEHVVNDLGDLAVEVDATGSQGAYFFVEQAVGGEGDDIVIDTNGDFRTAYVWLRLPDNVTAVDVSDFTQASGSDTTMPALDTGALAEADELVIYGGAGQDFAGTVPSGFTPSAGYTSLAVETIGGSGESDAHFIYVSYRDDAGPTAETPNVTWVDNVRKRYPMFVAFTVSAAGPSTVDLAPAAATFAAQALTAVPGVVVVTLEPALVALTAQPVTAVPGLVTVALTAAALALAAQAVTAVPGVVAVALTPAALTVAAIALTATPGGVAVTLAPAALALAAVAMSFGGALVTRPNTGLVVRPFTGTVVRP
jgi:hypothetical protein